jgi:hypothetical protein
LSRAIAYQITNGPEVSGHSCCAAAWTDQHQLAGSGNPDRTKGRDNMRFAYLACPLAALMALAAAGPSRADLQKAHDDRAIVAGTTTSVLVDVLANDGELGPGLRILKVFKPAHGSVSVENGRIRYTPTPGFSGSDSFRYMAQAEKSQPGQATVNVEVGPGGVAMQLRGQVVDSPIPGAVVTVSVGGFDFKTVADANGNYVLDIAALQGDAFVTLTATGESSSGVPIKFYSLVGEIVRLNNASGSDGVLTRDEFNQLNVTNLSTAQYSLLTSANGGSPPDSDQELLPLTQNIDLNKMLELAAIIKLVVDGGVPLPAGSTDLLDLISDPVAIADFKADLAPGQLDVAIDAVSEDPNLVPDFRPGAIPGAYTLISASAPGTIRVGASGLGIMLSFNDTSGSSGTGDSICDLSCGAFAWSLVGGDLQGTLAAPYTYHYQVAGTGAGCTGVVFDVSDALTGFQLHRLQDGAGVDFVETSFTYLKGYTDLNPADGCAPPADGPVTEATRYLAFEAGSGELPFAAGESFGRMAINFFTPDGSRRGAAIFDFDTHQVAIPEALPTFTHSVVNGRLQIGLTDAVTGQVTHYEYRRYQMDGSRGEGMLMIATLPDGSQRSEYNLSSRVQPGYAFDLATMAGNWRSGFDASQFPGNPTINPGFYVELNNDAARSGNQHSVEAGGAISYSGNFSWNVGPGGMVASYWKQPGVPGTLAACPSGSTTCFEIRRRTWEPLGRDGNRIYVLENIMIHTAPNQPWVPNPTGQRTNFYILQ